jgi:hypothetical protein
MSYEVWHHVETNGNPTFILGSYVFSDVFRGHGTNLWVLNIQHWTSFYSRSLTYEHWTCTLEEKWINCGNCEKKNTKIDPLMNFLSKGKLNVNMGRSYGNPKMKSFGSMTYLMNLPHEMRVSC